MYEIAATGMLIGINLVVRVVFDLIPAAPLAITVSPIYFTMLASVYLLKNRFFGAAFTVIVPWLWFVMGRAVSVNVADFVIEYWLPSQLTLLASLIPLAQREGRPGWRAWAVMVAIELFAMGVVRPFLTIWAGTLYYGVTWIGSAAYNAPNMYVDCAMTLVLLALTLHPLAALRRAVR